VQDAAKNKGFAVKNRLFFSVIAYFLRHVKSKALKISANLFLATKCHQK
jgi:hypothetical protein